MSPGMPHGGPPPSPTSGAPVSAEPGRRAGSPFRAVVDASPDDHDEDGRPRGARLAAAGEAIRGARSEVRRQLREQQRLRMWTLIALVVALVGALPFYFALRAAARDPVLTSLDALSVPQWAVAEKDDNITGSRWCLLDCRYRERTVQSKRPIDETAKVYQEALLGAGWVQLSGIPGCPPEVGEGEHASCWRRDEFTLDLWIREPSRCADDLLRKRPKIEPTGAASPGPEASGAPAPAGPPDDCSGSTVTIKVFNAIADERLHWNPEATPNPEIGELTDEDLATPDPTPTPQSS